MNVAPASGAGPRQGSAARPGRSTAAASSGSVADRQSALTAADALGLYHFLTATDRALIEYATGSDLGPDPEDGSAPHVPFAVHIARDRAAERLQPNQEITVRYLWEAARRYEAAGIEDHPFTGRAMERALEYLSVNSAGLCDVTV